MEAEERPPGSKPKPCRPFRTVSVLAADGPTLGAGDQAAALLLVVEPGAPRSATERRSQNSLTGGWWPIPLSYSHHKVLGKKDNSSQENLVVANKQKLAQFR